MEENELVACPKCNEPISAVIAAKLKEKTRLSFEITQEPGHMLSASTLGGLLTNNEKLFQALSKQHGTTSSLLVENIRMTGDKTIIDFQVVVPMRPNEKSSKRRGD